NIPLNRSFTTWAGWLTPYDRDFYLIVDEECTHCLEEAVTDLTMIGLDRVAGWFGVQAIEAWRGEGRPVESIDQVTTKELTQLLRDGKVHVLDVRGRAEWEAGHIPGVPNIPVGLLRERLGEVPRDASLVVQCQTGSRSAIAA